MCTCGVGFNCVCVHDITGIQTEGDRKEIPKKYGYKTSQQISIIRTCTCMPYCMYYANNNLPQACEMSLSVYIHTHTHTNTHTHKHTHTYIYTHTHVYGYMYYTCTRLAYNQYE
jgi:hypothetical protein